MNQKAMDAEADVVFNTLRKLMTFVVGHSPQESAAHLDSLPTVELMEFMTAANAASAIALAVESTLLRRPNENLVQGLEQRKVDRLTREMQNA